MMKNLLLPLIFSLFIANYSTAQCDGLNGDFENWEELQIQNIGMQTVTVLLPENWLSTSELFNVVFGAPPNQLLDQSTDAYSGDFALELKAPVGDTALVNAIGFFECDQVFGTLSGYYKLDGNALGLVQFIATEFMDTSSLVGVGFTNLVPVDEYTRFEVDITYSGPNVNPDTAAVTVFGESLDGMGFSLKIDNLQLDATSSIDDRLAEEYGIKLFPNPASDHFAIASNKYYDISLRMVDASGRPVIERDGVSPNQQVDIRHLPSGTYFLYVEQEDARKLFKVIKP